MRFEIASVLPRKPEKTVRLQLAAVGSGAMVSVVDEDGAPVSGGLLLSFTRDRRVKRAAGVSPDIGFELDEDGRIVEEDGRIVEEKF